MARADHRAAYEDLLGRYLAPLRRLAWAYEHDSDGRDDLFQEIAMALWTAWPRFRGDSSERTWVYRVAHNTALTFSASRRRRDSRQQAGEPPYEPALPASQERDAIAQQRRNLLWAAVQALPVDERQIVVLHLEGLSALEIEAITGVSAGAVATRLTRFRQRLATRLRETHRVDEERRA